MANLNLGFSAVAAGTADVITATYSPAITLSDRRIVFLTGCSPNLTTTPTFNPNTVGAQVIKSKGGVALRVGEIKGDCILIYHTTGTYWELLASQLTRSTLAQILQNGALTGGSAISGDNGEAYALINDTLASLVFDDGNVLGGISVDASDVLLDHDVEINLNAPSVQINGAEAATQAYADAKIAQTITNGVTTSAPSEDAVYDALLLKSNGSDIAYRKTGTSTLERWYTSATTVYATTTVALTRDVLRATPFIVEKPLTLDRIAMEITGAGTAGSVVRLGIYGSSNGIPTTRIVDAGTIAGDSATFQSININTQLQPGLYFLAFVHNSVANITFRAITVNQGIPNVLGVPSNLGAVNPANLISSTFTYSTLPDPFDNTGIAASGLNVAIVSVRLSA